MFQRLSIPVIALTGLLSTGCATLFAPGPDQVQVTSSPAGATVYLDERQVGITPCSVIVDRSSEGVFRFELEGHHPKVVDRDKVLNGVTLMNVAWVLFWPMVPVALLIDGVTGDIGKYSTEPLHASLVEDEDYASARRSTGRRRPGGTRRSIRRRGRE